MARAIVFGTLGNPASSAMRVVTSLESSRARNCAGGWMTSRPALAASASVSASNITNAAFPPGPRAAIHARISGSRRRWLQTSSIDMNSRCVRSVGTTTRGWAPSNESKNVT